LLLSNIIHLRYVLIKRASLVPIKTSSSSFTLTHFNRH
jgi:hypothetical protein